jgi:hypothetical protein
MGSHPLAVYTTVYRGCEPYLASWRESLQEQTDHDFDLWIGLDAITPDEVMAEAGGGLRTAHWIVAEPGDTPASLRQRAFAMLVNAYDEVVLVDADDMLQRSRIESARDALESCDVTACALRLVDESGRDLGLTSFGLDEEEDVDLHELLPRYNVFGLSNSAYRADALARCLPVPPSCELTDWLIATRALVTGAVLRFDAVPRMAYRRHDHNTALVLPPFDAGGVLAASTRVVHHYRLLLESDWLWPPGTRRPFEVARARAEAFHKAMRSSPATLDAYVTALNQLTPRYVWWWAVAHPDLEHLWSPAA